MIASWTAPPGLVTCTPNLTRAIRRTRAGSHQAIPIPPGPDLQREVHGAARCACGRASSVWDVHLDHTGYDNLLLEVCTAEAAPQDADWSPHV